MGIARLSSAGAYSHFAGSYGSGSGCSDGPGNTATFSVMSGMVVDTDDNIFLVQGEDAQMNAFYPCRSIRKITPNGFVSTVYNFSTGQVIANTLLLAQDGSFYYLDRGGASSTIRRLSPALDESYYCGGGSSGRKSGNCIGASIQNGSLVGFDYNGHLVYRDDEGLKKITP